MPAPGGSKTLGQFLETPLQMPRFQRGKKWSDRQRFELCLSVYRGLPIGAVVVSTQSPGPGGGSTSNRLLDGQQRWDALKGMRYPARIYEWARDVLNLEIADTDKKVGDKFWYFVEEWLGQELPAPTSDDEEFEEFDQTVTEDDDAEIDATKAVTTEGAEEEAPLSFGETGFRELLTLLRLCHGAQAEGHPFAQFFDFSDAFGSVGLVPEFAVPAEGRWNVDPDKLTDWIADRHRRGISFDATTLFAELRGDLLVDESAEKLKEQVDRSWEDIDARIRAIEHLQNRFRESEIGYIELANASPLEEMKVFVLINQGGTPLTYPEILSATSFWNRPVTDAPEAFRSAIERLYQDHLDRPPPDSLVRWDTPATLSYRWGELPLFFPKPRGASGRDSFLKLGFEVMSGVYSPKGRVTKEAYGNLGKSDSVPWAGNDLAEEVKAIHDLLVNHSLFFSKLAKWKVPLLSLLPKFVLLDFLLLAHRAWNDANKPTTLTGGRARALHKKLVRLLDRLILETLQGRRRGAGDAFVADELQAFDAGGSRRENLFSEAPASEWQPILKDFLEGSSVGGRALKVDSIDPRIYLLLRYYYVLRDVEAPDSSPRVDWDHIIPRSAFEGESPEIQSLQHRIFNLAALPRFRNRRKGDRFLDEISGEELLVEDVEKYAEIPRSKFNEFSKSEGINSLREYRGAILLEAFDAPRREWLSRLRPLPPS